MPIDIENFINEDLLNASVSNASKEPEKVLSFNRSVQLTDPIEKSPTPKKKKMIIRSWIIDKFTTKKIRVELTPSVCDVCAFDIAAEKHGNWYGVPDSKKADVLQAVIEHKREVHPVKEDLIIDEDDMPQQWLGDKGTTL
jgi:hypothetical protein